MTTTATASANAKKPTFLKPAALKKPAEAPAKAEEKKLAKKTEEKPAKKTEEKPAKKAKKGGRTCVTCGEVHPNEKCCPAPKDPAKAPGPKNRCGVHAKGKAEIEKVFGFRGEIPQPWCRACRADKSKIKTHPRAATETETEAKPAKAAKPAAKAQAKAPAKKTPIKAVTTASGKKAVLTKPATKKSALVKPAKKTT